MSFPTPTLEKAAWSFRLGVQSRSKRLSSKGAVRPSAPQWPAVRPDTTKLLRAVEDACNQILWRDDAQIVHQTAVKRYGEPARAEITIQPL